MVIRLGQGYWVDASDGQNWTLRHGDPKGDRKKGSILGYCSSLSRAIQMAVQHGLMTAPFDGDLGEANGAAAEVAKAILAEVEMEFSMDEDRGRLFVVRPREKRGTPSMVA